MNRNKTPAPNGRFGAMAAVPRRQYCGKLNVITPQQVQWKPPLRQAAGTLGDTCERQHRAKNERSSKNNRKKIYTL